MVLISDTPSAIKTRFGFTGHHQSDSMSSEIQIRSSLHTNTDREDDGVVVDSGSASQSFEFSEDPSFWKDHNVQVIIRIRPLSSSEISLQSYSKCVRQESSQTITWTGHPESRFTFDLVADENVSQEKLFKVAGVPMVENCVGGYNSCMFAYGQTGSGKTHTMLGDIEGGTRRHSVNCGMTPRVFEYLFQRIQKEREARRDEKLMFTCKCSFLEIYNEQILDLLDPSSNNLQIREDSKKGVYVENLKEVEVSSAREVILQLIQGAANRKVAATNMNRASSRSHSVFTCAIESKWESQGVTHHRFARLNLVDLAGSERQKSSGAEGERLKEATNINKSLSTLGLVIMNLVSISNGKSLHVPYRDSKLTFLLQDSLGGNSKTIIIANVSPSNCCSLETLSTLKFAQRAKFIKNNAIVNEDTTGDVIAMRQQIQQLKKEVARLRASINGAADNLDNDALSVTFPGSPGSFKWEGLHGSLTPLTSSKRTTSNKDYEVTLVGAFKREKDKELALQSLALENQAALQLAKQREDEIQGLKMMLRFREAGIKRLEAVASRKISAETHLLKEKEEHLKEIEVLRSQIDRNQEVTRFAMENLRLKEEIRRLKSFCEEGEREAMVEQIAALQNKLLEALDWKLMHESDASLVQRADAIAPNVQNNDNLLLSSKEKESLNHSSLKGENEFLRLQAIQDQAEIEALRKKLEFCQEEKEKLEWHMSDLDRSLEEERSLRVMEENFKQLQLASSTGAPIPLDDQMELKTMVDTIAAASQREAEAHEKAITLSKENDELRMKLKVLIEDNNKLIELYEQANAERRSSSLSAINSQTERAVPELSEEKEGEMRKAIEDLEHQLIEMHEENEKLMNLYEKAMQERDEIKRILCARGQNQDESKGGYDCPEKLVEVDEGERLQLGGTPDSRETNGEPAFHIPETFKRKEPIQVDNTNHLHVYVDKKEAGVSDNQNGDITVNVCLQLDESSRHPEKKISLEETAQLMKHFVFNESRMLNEESGFIRSNGHECRSEDHPVSLHCSVEPKPFNTVADYNLPEIELVKENLVNAQQQLESSVRVIATFSSVEKALAEDEELSRQYEELDGEVKLKQQQIELFKHLSLEIQERIALTDKKICALKYSLSELSSSLMYFEQREDRARARVCASSVYLEQRNKELVRLEACKSELDISLTKCQQFEEEERSKLSSLKLKLEEEKQKIENETVLFAIDNMEKADPSKHNLILGGKATDLLKSEEEKTKLQVDINACRERLGLTVKEYGELKEKRKKIEMQIQALQAEITKGRQTLEEKESVLHGVTREKEIVVEMTENGKLEADSLILTYQQHVFEENMKQEDIKILKEELEQDLSKMEKLKLARIESSHRKLQYLDEMKKNSCLSSKMEEELQIAMGFVEKAKLLLVEDSSK